METKENKDLKALYDSFYKKGEQQHYTTLIFSTEGDEVDSEPYRVVRAIPDWAGKTVLDVGCGTGKLVEEISKRGAAKVVGLDYSGEAIHCARARNLGSNVTVDCADFNLHQGTYDVVTSLGTLEHMDDPLKALTRMRTMLNPGGVLIVTTPNWTNPRGYILQTLRFLFDAPITLADLHYLTPVDFQRWAADLGMRLTWNTFDYSWAHGDRLVKDFTRRLPNVLIRDMKSATSQERIDSFITWIREHVTVLENDGPAGGALALYKLESAA